MNQGGELMVTYVPGEVAWGERAPSQGTVLLTRGDFEQSPGFHGAPVRPGDSVKY